MSAHGERVGLRNALRFLWHLWTTGHHQDIYYDVRTETARCKCGKWATR